VANYDLVVIGLGAVGGAALLAGVRAGARVAGFDRFAPPHTFGSTHGETRIVRAAIGEGTAYTPFAQRSFELWDRLHAETGERLVNRCGLLVLGGVLPHATHVPAGFLDTTIDAARSFGIAHEILSAGEVRARFPAYATFDGARAYFEPGAGFASPERVVAMQLHRARSHGATVSFGTKVESIGRDGDAVVISTATETTRAAHCILSAGAWIPRFLAATEARRLSVTRQTMHWFAPPEDPSAFEPARMPVFIWNDLYGFPPAVPGGGVKMATEVLLHTVDPDAAPREVGRDDIDEIVPRVRAAFPTLGAHQRGTTCLYTSTPDFHFWVGPHPDVAHVTVVSACSGHGFKHAAALGEAVVAKALGLPGLAIPEAWSRLGPSAAAM
jgi:sarcosine oxidase